MIKYFCKEGLIDSGVMFIKVINDPLEQLWT